MESTSCCRSSKCKPLPTEEELRNSVRNHYANVATSENASSGGDCCTDKSSCGDCCSDKTKTPPSNCCSAGSCFVANTNQDYAIQLGYSEEELSKIPDQSNLGLGCGNPCRLADIQAGETVLDLGSGAGFDAFIASRAVGSKGKVIGVDMTPEMITKAQNNAKKSGYENVEFRLGQIEDLPVEDSTVDVIISNCVINLVPNKEKAFKEAFRVLKPGGRLAISDTVTTVELPESVCKDLSLHAGCLAGASLISDLENWLKTPGFVDIKITPKEESRQFIKDWAPGMKLEEFILSANIQATKP